MGTLAAIGNSNLPQVYSDLFRNAAGVAKAGYDVEQNRAEMAMKEKTLGLQDAYLNIAKAEEDRKAKEYATQQAQLDREYPAEYFLGPMNTWDESQKSFVKVALDSKLATDTGGRISITGRNIKTFGEMLRNKPELMADSINLKIGGIDDQIGALRGKMAGMDPAKVPEAQAEMDRLLVQRSEMKTRFSDLISRTPSVAEKVAVETAKHEGGGSHQVVQGRIVQGPNGPVFEQGIGEGTRQFNAIVDKSGRVVSILGEAPGKGKWSEPYDMNIDGKKVRVQKNDETNEIRTVSTGPTVTVNAPTTDQISTLAKQIVDGRLDPNTISKRGGLQGAVYAEVERIAPGFNINEASANAKMKRSENFQLSIKSIDSLDPLLTNMETIHKKLNLSRFPSYNKAELWLRQNTGDPDVVALTNLRNDITFEIQRALTNTNMLTDTRIKIELENLQNSFAPAQMKAAVSNIRKILGARRNALMKDVYTPGTEGAEKGGRQEMERRTLKNGETWIQFSDGTFEKAQ